MPRLKRFGDRCARPRSAPFCDALRRRFCDGKGDGREFATKTFKTSCDVAGSLRNTWMWRLRVGDVFRPGNVVKSGTGPNFTYTCTPLIFQTVIPGRFRNDPPACAFSRYNPAWLRPLYSRPPLGVSCPNRYFADRVSRCFAPGAQRGETYRK